MTDVSNAAGRSSRGWMPLGTRILAVHQDSVTTAPDVVV